jgi:hypothetical protein
MDEETKLEDFLERVNDRDSFFAFVRALIRDREREVALESVSPSSPQEPGAMGWENRTIESYLVSALAWAESSDMGRDQGVPGPPSWKSFAAFLYCGKIYE